MTTGRREPPKHFWPHGGSRTPSPGQRLTGSYCFIPGQVHGKADSHLTSPLPRVCEPGSAHAPRPTSEPCTGALEGDPCLKAPLPREIRSDIQTADFGVFRIGADCERQLPSALDKISALGPAAWWAGRGHLEVCARFKEASLAFGATPGSEGDPALPHGAGLIPRGRKTDKMQAWLPPQGLPGVPYTVRGPGRPCQTGPSEDYTTGNSWATWPSASKRAGQCGRERDRPRLLPLCTGRNEPEGGRGCAGQRK